MKKTSIESGKCDTMRIVMFSFPRTSLYQKQVQVTTVKSL
jgi:hypothetical protein